MCFNVCVYVCWCMRTETSKANKAMNLRAYFHRKKAAQVGFEPRPPAFEAVVLPTESLRQPSLLGSNHTSYARQSVQLALINRVNSNSRHTIWLVYTYII